MFCLFEEEAPNRVLTVENAEVTELFAEPTNEVLLVGVGSSNDRFGVVVPSRCCRAELVHVVASEPTVLVQLMAIVNETVGCHEELALELVELQLARDDATASLVGELNQHRSTTVGRG
jgi:hypothetical protein